MSKKDYEPICLGIISVWMIEHGYATGHGDTVDDLLQNLEMQVLGRAGAIMERNARATPAQMPSSEQHDSYGFHDGKVKS